MTGVRGRVGPRPGEQVAAGGEEPDSATGTVEWFDSREGVGLIVLDDGRRLSVRRDQIDDGGSQCLTPKARVRFALSEVGSGPVVSGVYRL